MKPVIQIIDDSDDNDVEEMTEEQFKKIKKNEKLALRKKVKPKSRAIKLVRKPKIQMGDASE